MIEDQIFLISAILFLSLTFLGWAVVVGGMIEFVKEAVRGFGWREWVAVGAVVGGTVGVVGVVWWTTWMITPVLK